MQVGWEYDNKIYTHEEMLALARTYPPGFPWTPEMIKAMYSRERVGVGASPSTLVSCPRKLVLERETEWTQEPEKAYAAFRGTMAHTLLEHLSHEPDAICERRVRVLVDLLDGRQMWLSGKPDKLVPSQSLIVDYKTLKELKGPNSPKDSWTPQLSTYRWMLSQDHEWLDEEALEDEKLRLGRRLTLEEESRFWHPEEGFLYERAQIAQLTMEAAGKVELRLWPLDATASWVRGRMRGHFASVFDGTYNLDNLPPVLQVGLDSDTYLCWGRRDKKTGKEISRPWCNVYQSCRAAMKEGR